MLSATQEADARCGIDYSACSHKAFPEMDNREMDLSALWLPKFPAVFVWWGRQGCPHTGYSRCCVDWRGGKVSHAEDVRQGWKRRRVGRGD